MTAWIRGNFCQMRYMRRLAMLKSSAIAAVSTRCCCESRNIKLFSKTNPFYLCNLCISEYTSSTLRFKSNCFVCNVLYIHSS